MVLKRDVDTDIFLFSLESREKNVDEGRTFDNAKRKKLDKNIGQIFFQVVSLKALLKLQKNSFAFCGFPGKGIQGEEK